MHVAHNKMYILQHTTSQDMFKYIYAVDVKS